MYLLHYLFWATLMALNCSQNVRHQNCTIGWFGSDCQYRCHCINNTKCRREGSCKDGICERGWFGPNCQYADLLNIKDSPINNWINDDNANTCNPDQSFTVTVNMASEFPFTWLRLQVSQPSPMQEFQVTFTDNKNQSKVCKNMRRAAVNETVLDIHCDMDELVQYVNLGGAGVKSLCSLYISGGRNVALRQKTSQSSTYKDNRHNSNISASWNAVDGNVNGDWQGKSCTSTKGEDKNSNWNVTLSPSYIINRYVIYNRIINQSHKDRIKGFTLRSFTKNLVMVFNYTDTESQSLSVYKITNTVKSPAISLVNIQIKNNAKNYQTLNICEVELYGDSLCQSSKYGRKCEHTCNCAEKDESCFVSTGGCPSGCADGYRAENCKTPCGFGKYGYGCKNNCSQFCIPINKTHSPCSHINGSCLHGCLNGYQAPRCDVLLKAEEKNIILLTVPLVVFIIVVMVTVLGVFLWRRFMSASNKQPSNESKIDVKHDLKERRYEQVQHNEVHETISSTRNKRHQNSAVSRESTPKHIFKYVMFGNNSKNNVNNCNTTHAMSSSSVSVRELSRFIPTHDKVFFQQQFNSIPANMNATTNVGLSEENKNKNRYTNICAYDHSRVLLKTCNLKKWGDYTNASYIDGYKGQRRFIASQGPKKVTLKDFVRMLLEQDVEIVVMLTNLTENGKTKCERYWPEDDEIRAGDIEVKLTTTQVFADFTIRRLQLLRDGDCVHDLTQFHFTAWPDKDVPTTAWSLVDFEHRVASFSTDKPVVIHCSAGVGRTGTFIALCNVIMEAKDTGYIDFFTAVQKLRQDRSFMVQTSDQYEFLHRAALVACVCMRTTIVSSNFADRIEELNHTTESGDTKLEQEFKELCGICDDAISPCCSKVTEQSSSTYKNVQTLSNELTNGFQQVLAREDYRVTLMGGNDECLGDYINAVFIPSLNRKRQQILTQIPLPTTVNDFWRMITQYKVTLVVAFELNILNSDFTCEYLPWNEDEEVCTPNFTIKSTHMVSYDLWDKQKLVITIDTPIETIKHEATVSADKEHRLTHITYKGTLTDQTPSDLLAVMKEVRSCKPTGDGPVVYMCRNGAEYSGLVCVLSLLLERLDNDLHLTVPLVVGAVKSIRPEVIPTVSQYSLLYQVLQMYNDSNNIYNNCGTGVFI